MALTVRNTFIHLSDDDEMAAPRSESVPPQVKLNFGDVAVQASSMALLSAGEAEAATLLDALMTRPSLSGATIVVQNLPKTMTQHELLQVWIDLGFLGKFDLFHLPVDARKQRNLGFCLLNFVSVEECEAFRQKVDGFKLSHPTKGPKACLCAGARVQGFKENVKLLAASARQGGRASENCPIIIDPATRQLLPFPEHLRQKSVNDTEGKSFEALARQFFKKVNTIVSDTEEARMIAGGILQPYSAPAKLPELHVLLKTVEEDTNRLKQIMSYVMNRLVSAGHLKPSDETQRQVLTPSSDKIIL